MKNCCENCTVDMKRLDELGHEFAELLSEEGQAIEGAIAVLKEKINSSDNDDQEEAQGAREFIHASLLRLRWIAANMANFHKNIDEITDDFLKVEAGYIHNEEQQ